MISSFSPAWSPGERIHFALAGFIDITGNGKDDRDLVSRLIELNGGAIDDEVRVQTRYVVEGEYPTAKPGGDVDADMQEDFTAKIKAAGEIGIDRLSPNKLLTLMGWRADVTTISLGYRIGLSKRCAPCRKNPQGLPSARETPPRGTDGAY